MPRKTPIRILTDEEKARVNREKTAFERAAQKTLQLIIDAEPGDQIIYRTDQADKEREPTLHGAREAYLRGFCELVQRRRPEDRKLEYIAVRRKVVAAPRPFYAGI